MRHKPDDIEKVSFGRPARPLQPEELALAVQDALSAYDRAQEMTVLVNDPQRHIQTRRVLEILARHVDPSRTRLVVATGSHKFSLAARQQFEAELAGPDAYQAISWHDCRSKELVRLGDSWLCHPWLLESRPLLAIGSVEPHYFAGFTGAHKTATIGCASYGDIERNHSHAMDVRCRPCQLEGNPVYEGVAEMLWRLLARRELSVVNLVQAGDTAVAAYGGEPFSTLASAATAAMRTFVKAVPPVDGIVANVAGPLGRSFYQAEKGIKNSEWAVRDGGCLILQASCEEGIGQDAFVDLLRDAPTFRQAAETVAIRGYRLGDHKAVRLRYLTDKACRNVRVYVVSPGISQDQAELMGMLKAPNVESALSHAGLSAGRDRLLEVDDAGNYCLLPATYEPT